MKTEQTQAVNSPLDARVKRLFEYVEERNATAVYRSEFFSLVGASLRSTLGESRMVRRAKAFAHLLDSVNLAVQPHELIGGTIAGLYPEVQTPSSAEREAEAREVVETYLRSRRPEHAKRMRQTMYGRIHYHGNIHYRDLQNLIRKMNARYNSDQQLQRHEIGYVLEKHFTWDFGEDARLVGELPWEGINHNDLNPPRLLALGLGGMRDEAAGYVKNCDPEQKEFYECALTAAEALIRFVQRYAGEFSLAAAAEKNAARSAELLRIAEAMRKVATRKPETFFEALQLLWLVYTVSQMQTVAGSCASYARFDQYMYPFYKKDIEAGRLTEDEALALICNLYVKTNEPKMRMVVSLCVGGQTPDGGDAANDLSRLCLRAVQLLRQPFPNVSVRIHDNTPEWLWNLAVETIKCGSGNPMLLNDNVWVKNFHRGGCELADARDYYNMGCVEMMLMGKVARWCNLQDINFPNLLQRVLDNGNRDDMAINKHSASGGEERIYTSTDGLSNFPFPAPTVLATGEFEELDTFDKFLDAFKRQLYHQLADLKERSTICDRIHDEYWCDPFGSLLIEGCMEKGRDLYRGGAKYDPWKVVTGLGLGTAVDSLMALKKFVYDEKILDLRQMKELLDLDFAGHEDLRQLFQNGAPTFGNDSEEVDALARRIFGWYADATDQANRQGIRGYAVTSSFSYTAQVTLGEATGAMPNGRRRGEIISDSIGPSQGKDMCGPTRMLRSVTAINPADITGASSVNLKLNPDVVKGAQGSKNMKALFKGFMANGGSQLQVNFVDTSTLKAAQSEPDKYKSLVVRVAGYCEYFNNLDFELQNEIIARSEHGLG